MTTTPNTQHRMKVMLSVIAMQVCLGGLYAWSILFPALLGEWKTATATVGSFSAIMFAFGCTMWVANRMVLCTDVHALCVSAALLTTIGPLCAIMCPGVYPMYVVSGLFTGAGVAIGMVVPRRAINDTFMDTDDQQLLTRTVSIAFGAAAFLMAPLFVRLVAHGMTVHFIGTMIINNGVLLTTAILLRGTGKSRFTSCPQPSIKHRVSPIGLAIFSVGACAGLSVIAMIAMLVVTKGANMVTAGAFVGLLGLANGFGRVIGFTMIDRLRLNSAMAIAATVQAIGTILLASTDNSVLRVAVAVTLVGLGYGALVAMSIGTTQAPLMTAGSVNEQCELILGLAGVIGATGIAFTIDLTGSATAWLQAVACASAVCAVLVMLAESQVNG